MGAVALRPSVDSELAHVSKNGICERKIQKESCCWYSGIYTLNAKKHWSRRLQMQCDALRSNRDAAGGQCSCWHTGLDVPRPRNCSHRWCRELLAVHGSATSSQRNTEVNSDGSYNFILLIIVTFVNHSNSCIPNFDGKWIPTREMNGNGDSWKPGTLQ